MNRHDRQRREVIRAIAAGGLALGIPVVLGGCGRNQDEQAVQPGSPTTFLDEGGDASKESVDYQYEPRNGEMCSTCLQFVAESSTCRIVAGPIDPRGWCRAYVAKGVGQT